MDTRSKIYSITLVDTTAHDELRVDTLLREYHQRPSFGTVVVDSYAAMGICLPRRRRGIPDGVTMVMINGDNTPLKVIDQASWDSAIRALERDSPLDAKVIEVTVELHRTPWFLPKYLHGPATTVAFLFCISITGGFLSGVALFSIFYFAIVYREPIITLLHHSIQHQEHPSRSPNEKGNKRPQMLRCIEKILDGTVFEARKAYCEPIPEGQECIPPSDSTKVVAPKVPEKLTKEELERAVDFLVKMDKINSDMATKLMDISAVNDNTFAEVDKIVNEHLKVCVRELDDLVSLLRK